MTNSEDERSRGRMYRPLTAQSLNSPLPKSTIPFSLPTSTAVSTATASTSTTHFARAPTLVPEQSEFSLGFDNTHILLDSFLSNLRQTIVKGKKQFIDKRTDYQQKMSELKAEQISIESEIVEYQKRAEELAEQKAAQQREIMISHEAINNFTQTKNDMEKIQDTLVRDIDEMKLIIQTKKEEQQKQREVLSKQIAQINPELQFWEETLGLRIEGVREDVLRFVFTNIDADDFDRMFMCTIDLSERDYKIIRCRPELDKTVLDQILSTLNKSRKFNVFLKELWKAFKDYVAYQGASGF